MIRIDSFYQVVRTDIHLTKMIIIYESFRSNNYEAILWEIR